MNVMLSACALSIFKSFPPACVSSRNGFDATLTSFIWAQKSPVKKLGLFARGWPEGVLIVAMVLLQSWLDVALFRHKKAQLRNWALK